MHLRAPTAVEIIANRLHCGSRKAPHLYEPLYTLGSLAGRDLEDAIVARLDAVYADHDPARCAFHHGLWCEAHMPALLAVRANKASTMQQIYAQKLQPEAALLRDLVCPDAISVNFGDEMAGALCGSTHLRGTELICSKLLEKCLSICGNHTESVRYIRAQFTKAHESGGPRGVAYLLAGCILLGMVPGGTLAPTRVRIKFHTDADAEVARVVETLPSRSLWFSLIVVVNEVCFRQPVLRMCRSKGGYAPQFDVDAVSIAKFEAVKASLIPSLQGDATKTIAPPEIKRKSSKRKEAGGCDHIEGVKHKRRLTENTVSMLFGGNEPNPKLRLAPIYRAILAEAPRGHGIDRALLERHGIDNVYGETVYEHAVEQRRTLSLIPAPHTPAEPTQAIVCLDCYTVRTRLRGAAHSKATESTILMMDGTHTCAACRGRNCISVDVSNFYISTLARHIDAAPTVARRCGACGYLACVTNVVGTTPVCAACFGKFAEDEQAAKRCCVCAKALSKRSHYMFIVAAEHSTATPKVATVCAQCKGLESHSGKAWSLWVLRRLHMGREAR